VEHQQVELVHRFVQHVGQLEHLLLVQLAQVSLGSSFFEQLAPQRFGGAQLGQQLS